MNSQKSPPSGRDLTPEELDLWASVTRDARALDPTVRRRSAIDENTGSTKPVGQAIPEQPPKRAKPAKRDARETAAPAPRQPDAPRPGAGTDRRTQVRLRRGQVSVDARIDLHGMTQAQARARLEGFLDAGAASGHRCVLVITGKGSSRRDDDPGFMPDRERGVLREQVPRWLALPPLSRHVITWQPAARRHGGDGALYVLLRRAK